MSEARSLRDELQASMDTLSAEPEVGAAPAPAPEPAPIDPPAASAEPAPAAEPAKADADDGKRRGPDGKFLPKTDTPPTAESAPAAAAPPAGEQPQPETAKPASTEPAPQTTRVPPSLPAAIKAKFGNLDPDVQQAFVALEETVQTAKAEWTQKGQRLNRYDEIIGPHADRWRVAGMDEFSGIQSLIAAQSLLDRNPVDGIGHIARSYGLSPAQLAQAFGLTQTSAPPPGQEGQPAPTANPDFQAALQTAVAPLVSELQTLKQGFTQTQQAAEAAELQSLASRIIAFSEKPENLYYGNVEGTLLDTLKAMRSQGQPITDQAISEAYDRAIWSDPTIRPLLLQSQADAQVAEKARKEAEAAKQAEAAARAKAQEAARAAGSVTGSPAPGSQLPGGGSSGNLREDLKAAWQQHAAV
jgi:hypothetical protein